MCGITGILHFDKHRQVEQNQLKKMTDIIQHRGPDDEGYFIDNNIGLGFRRLSIIDLKSGHQPLCDNNGRYWITFNGEIYNFQEQREILKKKGYIFRTNSDTEVIVNLYAEYKEKCVDYLRGMFAFVIWDKKEKELFGARDRFGIKPFYYYMDNEKFVWGSEIKSINASKDIKKDIDAEALDSYFAYGYIFNSMSIFKQIRKLKPGHCFLLKPFKDKHLVTQKYWEINFEQDYSKSEAYWKEAVREILLESVKMRMISDVPLGAFLSGGVDSSSVVALMATLSKQPIKTFSIGFKEEKYNELKYARQLADLYQTKHHEMIVEPESIDLLPKLVHAYDEPFADSSSIPTYYVSKFAREHVTVALSGDGGDELFAGYNSYAKMLALRNNPINNRFTNKPLFGNINKLLPDYFYGKGYSFYLSKNKNYIGAYFCMWKDYERKKLFSYDINQKLGSYSSEELKVSILNKIDATFISRMQGLDMKTYMAEDILAKVDRASMMNSLETRVPILDHKLAELSFTIPWKFKINKTSKKHILKEAMKDLLPPDILSHKKQGFGVPLTIWFKGELRSYAFDNLQSKDANLYDYVNKNYVNTVLGNHQKGIRDYSGKLWSLLFFNEWLKQNK
jgi:asparagine synthase (glutamine-hydrolysing)